MEQTAAEPVPLHLRNAPTRLMKGIGYGKDYHYAHDIEAKVTAMQCLPDSLRTACTTILRTKEWKSGPANGWKKSNGSSSRDQVE